ncbi:GNAT family N-acetyltransferase [Pseudomonas sp. URMO17WK12:I2]|uniref:GNAT family N-acetyltransferase n=1 Tax=Pseudomonas sp. URMO17WK12:I2 TaxID=1261623 RepID=UPI000DAF696F|nr:GNAT family N-acetyltransferase [Pseudomonas sp. URMO17WK12:I2]PZW43412.1 ribosomal protein S18 acetylase RimI-like enzyme [Pseudomonas sp. URMO17WK12:I2]
MFRRARVRDATDIVALIQSSFELYHLDKIIYGCRGVVLFLERQLALRQELSDVSVYVAHDGTKVIAVAQFKKIRASGIYYLDYICTDSRFRGGGVGAGLLRYALSSESFDYSQVALDVFEHNTSAALWYKSLGFEERFEKKWAKIEIYSQEGGAGYIANLPQAIASFESYGFAQLTVSTDAKNYQVGLLGDGYYRLGDNQVFSDTQAINALLEFDPHREFLLIVDEMPIVEAAAVNQFAKTINMLIDAKRLRTSLGIQNGH